MELRDRYIHAISRPDEKRHEDRKEDTAMLDDMKFALEFLKFSGRKSASPRDVVALAKVAEFYRKHYEKKRSEIKPAMQNEDEVLEAGEEIQEGNE